MKLDKRAKTTTTTKNKAMSKTNVNSHKKSALIVVCAGIAVASIVWVLSLGKKAEASVDVLMSAKNLYKNEQITDFDSQIKVYSMSELEYNKYARQGDPNHQRIIRADNPNVVMGMYMAYYVPVEHVLEYDMFVKSKIENSDTVLYAFPGKEIVSLQLGTGDLTAFKTFLTTGDRINIECTYTENVRVYKDDAEEAAYGQREYEDVEQFYTVPVFSNIQIADILNSDGDSILDMQAAYNELTIFEQAAYDSDTNYQKKLEPNTILLALTPQEKREYYKYLSKGGTFRMSLPQRTE